MELQASNPAPLPPMQSPFSQNTRHLSSVFICFVFAVVFSVVLSVTIRLFLHRQAGLRAGLHHAPPPLPPEKPCPFIADSLPSVVFSPQAQTRSADCAICLSDFANGEMFTCFVSHVPAKLLATGAVADGALSRFSRPGRLRPEMSFREEY
ncbi:hypothetical protein MA16_Dca010696 [Dendrobium catenatum]|uniref:Uncharacterized protein n=1 Tax=Dendrobium catenatum TaxID=906689 RepID=A0A2I0VK33_9ASPA|nr:hypothetical protein MA16_Dca010696 [Dendrobium catenatum]